MTDSSLVGARIRRLDAPASDLLAITLALGGERPVLLVALGARPGIGLSEDRPRGLPADAFVRKLRKELEGGLVRTFHESQPGLVELVVERSGVCTRLLLELDRQSANLILVDASDRIVAARDTRALRAQGRSLGGSYVAPAPGARALLAGTPQDLWAAGDRLLAGREENQTTDARRVLTVEIARTRKRVERRLRAIEGDAARAESAPELRKRASLVLANLHRIESGAPEAALTDWELDPPRDVIVPLDPTLPAQRYAETLFHRARRMERGAEIARSRRAKAEAELEALDRITRALEAATTDEEITTLREEASALLPRARASKGPSSRRRPPTRLPYREYRGSDARTILVGRGAADNDSLTLHHARPQDLWLHARGTRGAHVVVPLHKGETCPPELLIDAATLAAHFSDVRGESTAEVQYCARRHLRKPKGAAPGAVVVSQEKVIVVRVEAKRLARLLESEDLSRNHGD